MRTGASLQINVITDGPNRQTLSPPAFGASAQSSIQAKLDFLASHGGGTLRLRPGYYPVDAIVQPTTVGFAYRNVRVVGLGQGATIIPDSDNTNPLWYAGNGWVSHYDPKLTGLKYENLIFDGRRDDFPNRRQLLRIEGDEGTTITGCRLLRARAEALMIGGGLSSIGGDIRECYAAECGQPAYAPFGQNLAAYNINGYQWRAADLEGEDNGWFMEMGGTDFVGTRLRSTDGDIVFGSNSFGTSDVEFNDCDFVRTFVGWGNGVGKTGQVRIIGSRFTDGGVSPNSGNATNNVQLDDYPFTASPSLVQGNTFTITAGAGGAIQPIRIIEWASLAQQFGMATSFSGNTYNVPTGHLVLLVMGGPQEAVSFTGETFNAPQHLGDWYARDVLNNALTNYIANMSFVGCTLPSGAFIDVSPNGEAGWPDEVTL